VPGNTIEDNPYQPPSTKLETDQGDLPQQRSFLWKVFLFIYIVYPLTTRFIIPNIYLFNYGQTEVRMQTPDYLNWFDHLAWGFYALCIIAMIGFIWNRKIIARRFWTIFFHVCLYYVIASYLYTFYREYTIFYQSSPEFLGWALMALHLVISLFFDVPALMATYLYGFQSRWIWNKPKPVS
jgi:hypothetical protein